MVLCQPQCIDPEQSPHSPDHSGQYMTCQWKSDSIQRHRAACRGKEKQETFRLTLMIQSRHCTRWRSLIDKFRNATGINLMSILFHHFYDFLHCLQAHTHQLLERSSCSKCRCKTLPKGNSTIFSVKNQIDWVARTNTDWYKVHNS